MTVAILKLWRKLSDTLTKVRKVERTRVLRISGSHFTDHRQNNPPFRLLGLFDNKALLFKLTRSGFSDCLFFLAADGIPSDTKIHESEALIYWTIVSQMSALVPS